MGEIGFDINALQGDAMAQEWECSECGHVATGLRAPMRCPDCGSSRNHFQQLDMQEEDEDEALDLIDSDDDEEEEDEEGEDLDWDNEDDDLADDE